MPCYVYRILSKSAVTFETLTLCKLYRRIGGSEANVSTRIQAQVSRKPGEINMHTHVTMEIEREVEPGLHLPAVGAKDIAKVNSSRAGEDVVGQVMEYSLSRSSFT